MAIDLLPEIDREKAWQPESWGPRHRLAIALHAGGDKNTEIAEKLEWSLQYVSVILNDPRAMYELERLSQGIADRVVDTQLRIKLYANEALDEIIQELRTSRNEKVRQTAAFGILDRAGYVPLRDTTEKEAPMLPSEVVERMEATTKELIEYDGVYREVEPKVREEEIVRDAYEADVGAARGETDDE